MEKFIIKHSAIIEYNIIYIIFIQSRITKIQINVAFTQLHISDEVIRKLHLKAPERCQDSKSRVFFLQAKF